MESKNKIIIMIYLVLTIISAFCASAQAFVETDGTEFVENGNPFYFSGANNYYLFYKPVSNVQEVMDDAVSLGLKVIRTWGFCDGICSSGNYNSFQSSPGVYNEATFQRFDRIIKDASDRGLRLTVPLVNNWDEFGGMCQYVKWCGLPDASICDADEPWPFGAPTQSHDLFYSESCTKQIYKDYVNHFLNRNNTLTGVLYKDDPTIFAWELANEPRARSDPSTVTLNNWIGEMSAYIKSIDSNHMVTPGSDGGYKDKVSDPEWSWWYHGNEGQDYIGNHQWSSVDFATFRYYPESGKFDDVNPQLWILEHIDDAHYILGKPVVMEEFGSFVNKDTVLADYYNQLEVHGANGDTFWILVDHLATGNDGYFVSCPEDYAVCNVISNHAAFMNNMSIECSTDDECDYLDAGYCDTNNVMHDEGRCIVGQCQAETTIIEDCDDGNPLTVDTCLANLTCSHVQENQECVVPYDNMVIDHSMVFCSGTYSIPNGMNITADGVVLDCNGSTLNGVSSSYMIRVNSHSGGGINNCQIINSLGINGIGSDYLIAQNDMPYSSIYTDGDNTVIANNIVRRIQPRGSNLSILYNNLDTGYDHSIYLVRVYASRIIGNNITSIGWGRSISLDGVEDNLFQENIIHNGGSAVYCWYSCRNNQFIGNSFLSNVYGITGSNANNYYGTTICSNDFDSNTNDIGLISSTTSIWDCDGEGNHWSRYDEPVEGCSNTDDDSICDSPYDIQGTGNIDNFPITPYSQSPQINCTVPSNGMDITSDTQFCPGNYTLEDGIDVTGSSITLDCQGALLQGIRKDNAIGIHVTATHSTIKNCIVDYYEDVVKIENGGDNVFAGNRLTGSRGVGPGIGRGLWIVNSDSNEIINNSIILNQWGFSVTSSNSTVILGNEVTNNSIYGLSLSNSMNCVIESNEASYNDIGIILWGAKENLINDNSVVWNFNQGIFMSTDSDNNNLTRNTLERNHLDGIRMYYADSNHISYNEIRYNTQGIIMFNSTENYIWNNNLIGNQLYTQINNAYDDLPNYWFVGNEGNYYHDYDEPSEGCQDINSDYRCDAPNDVGNSSDYYAYTQPSGREMGVSCYAPYEGMVITETLTLCPGNYNLDNGLVMGKDNVVLDCDGANIIGPGSGIGISAQGDFDLEHWAAETENLKNLSPITENLTGFVDSIAFLEDITIINCNIEGFENGMNLTAVKNLELRDNVVHDNNAGIIYGTYYGTIADNLVYNNQNGIVGAGINSTLENNEVYGSNMGMIVAGIGNSVSGNNIHDNPGTGITVGGFDNLVYNNNAKNNLGNDGISLVYSSGAEVYNNTAEFNGRAGISIIEGSNNTVSDNIMRNNRFGFGMQGLFSQGPSSGNVISNNTITQNTESGLALHDGVIWDIGKLIFPNMKIKGHKVIDNTFTGNYLDNPLSDLYVYGKEVRNNKIFGNDFYGAGVINPGDNNYCVGNVGNNYYNGAQEAPGEC
ncbi:MAG: right-handed parallel beta-helix repeat-containing protein [Nanoarchaeota archaeon]|nr:right-handed parallel beta-helix repeat-containing protein [Nanoarchaeota archaeon]